MTDDADWGEWQTHDGKVCPCVGQVVRLQFNDQSHTVCGPIVATGHPASWVWDFQFYRWWKILKYQIRKPRGLTILEGLLENLPEQVDA